MGTEPDFNSVLATIRGDDELSAAFTAVARTIQDRNDSPRSLHFATSNPEPTELLGFLEAHIIATLGAQNDSDDAGFFTSERCQRVLAQLLNEDEDTSFPILVRQLMIEILYRYIDGVDRYVETLQDFTLVQELGLDVDAEGLTNLRNPRIEVLPHGLRVDTNVRLYLHQFLRRYFSGNFVQLPRLLSKAMTDGHEVRVRVDPLRRGLMTDYEEVIEEDYWFGPKFDLSVLNSTDKPEVRTVHATDETSIAAKLLGMSYPVTQTHFRTSMLGDGLRQFSIEEYVPPKQYGGKSCGSGTRYHIQKFAHLVYDQESGTFEHVDCAVRVHGVEEYDTLFTEVQEGRDPGRRTGNRFKLFKISGRLELSIIQELLCEYFRYNLHPVEYFGNLTSDEAFEFIKNS